MKTKYVVDTNVLVHWLLKPDGLAAQIINSFTLELFTPAQAIQELLDHANDWLQRYPGISVNEFVGAISQFMDIVPPPYDPKAEDAATNLVGRKDAKDITFVTLALIKGADIWSYDAHFDGLPVVARLRSEDIRNRSVTELPELWAWVNRAPKSN